MPLFDYVCNDCGRTTEILSFEPSDTPKCPACGSGNMEKLMSAHSSMSGPAKFSMPGPGDTGCCGSSPDKAKGCKGPGTCCGRN